MLKKKHMADWFGMWKVIKVVCWVSLSEILPPWEPQQNNQYTVYKDYNGVKGALVTCPDRLGGGK